MAFLVSDLKNMHQIWSEMQAASDNFHPNYENIDAFHDGCAQIVENRQLPKGTPFGWWVYAQKHWENTW